MTKIFYAIVDKQLSLSSFCYYLNLLPDSIKSTVVRYRNWKDQHLVLFGKLLLQEGLKHFEYYDLTLNSLRYSRYKRPYFEGKIDFNISHSGNCVLCVISDDSRVGIDIEEIKPLDVVTFQSQWTDKEWRYITKSKDIYHQFFKFWTKKEAVIKADGRGLNIPLAEIDVTSEIVCIGRGTWFLNEIKISDDCVAHLASGSFIEMDAIFYERLFFKELSTLTLTS